MSYLEKDHAVPARHNPYLHELVIDKLKALKPGGVLDIPAGPGYLVQDLNRFGFQAVAGEIDESLHCFKDVSYRRVDMTRPFPFPDASFEYLTSIEGIEHIENHLAFIRETARVLKPGGRLFLTTPNIHSLSSRLNFLFSGFHEMAKKPIPTDTENIYFEHINPISFPQLYFYCERSGLEVEQLLTYRKKKGAWMVYCLFFPFIWLACYRACFLVEKKPHRREKNKKLFHFLISRENQLGSHTVVVARKR